MKRRQLFNAAAAAFTAAAMTLPGLAQAQDTIKIGAIAPKTGPLAGGALVTQWPNVELWAKQITPVAA